MRRVGSAAQHPVHEEPVEDHIAAARRCGVAADCVVGDPATETIATAFSVEPEQMTAIGERLDAPELYQPGTSLWCSIKLPKECRYECLPFDRQPWL